MQTDLPRGSAADEPDGLCFPLLSALSTFPSLSAADKLQNRGSSDYDRANTFAFAPDVRGVIVDHRSRDCRFDKRERVSFQVFVGFRDCHSGWMATGFSLAVTLRIRCTRVGNARVFLD